MFLSCKNFCSAQEKQHELVVYETKMLNGQQQPIGGNFVELSQISISQPVIYSKLIKSSYELLLKECINSKRPYNDPDFPPNAKSIGQYIDPRDKKIVWKRLTDIVKNPILIDTADPMELMRGNLGDCYFVSSLAALAETPQRIKSIFGSTDISPYGIYMTRVNVAGVARQIMVDDWFPVYEQSNCPVFAKPHENEVWLMVIEKVWAKLSGSYSRISSGYPHQVLSFFTNAPCFYSQLSSNHDMTSVWRYLLEATKQHFVVCCGSRAVTDAKDDGIVPLHTYTLLGSYEVLLEGGTHRIIKLRNPWDFKTYRGRFSKQDQDFWRKVDPKQAISIGYSRNLNNQVLFMSFADFLEKFQSCDIAHVQQNYSYNFETYVSEKKHGVYFEIQIKAESATDCYFTLHQDNLKKSSLNLQRLRYSRATIVIAKKHNIDTYQYIASKIQSDFPSMSIKCRNIQPGRYIVYCKIEWNENPTGSMTLSTYSPSIVEIGLSEKKLHPGFIQNVMLSHAIANPKKQGLDSINQWICMQLMYKEGAYAYIAAFVQSGSKKILMDFSLEEFQKAGFKIKGFKGPKQTRIKLIAKAGQPQIIVCRIKENNENKQLVFPPDIKISQSI